MLIVAMLSVIMLSGVILSVAILSSERQIFIDMLNAGVLSGAI
jgi:hypothetical protein